MKRYGMIIKVKEDKLEEYRKLHADPWPEVVKKIKECNIRNYSIYYRNGWLFGYWEYTGNNFEEDMKKMSEDPITQEWWKLTDPCQIPLDDRMQGEWWAKMEEVFHVD
jgi:L-rhamnose mutarotase